MTVFRQSCEVYCFYWRIRDLRICDFRTCTTQKFVDDPKNWQICDLRTLKTVCLPMPTSDLLLFVATFGVPHISTFECPQTVLNVLYCFLQYLHSYNRLFINTRPSASVLLFSSVRTYTVHWVFLQYPHSTGHEEPRSHSENC